VAKKVLQLVTCCDDCPRKSYYSGGRSECTEAGTILPFNEGHTIPEWCPLTAYPSDAVERREDTIKELRRQLEAARDEKLIAEAADAMRLWTGHDSQPNIERKFGKQWWEPIKKIEDGLRKMLPPS
jgi:hypothetical protein